MRTFPTRWVLPLALTLSVIGCMKATQQTPAVDTAAATAALDSLNKAFVAAVAARDTDAVVAFYADDAHVLAPGEPRADGKAAIRKVWVQFLSTPGLDLQITGSQPIVDPGGDMIIDIGSYNMKMNDAKGKPMEDVGKYTTIFRKENDGSWKIIVDMINSDKPPTSM